MMFNHIYYNGQDACKKYQAKRTDIMKHFTFKSEAFEVDKDKFWISKIYFLSDQ